MIKSFLQYSQKEPYPTTVQSAYETVAQKLNKEGLATRYYTLPVNHEYDTLLTNPATQIHRLESLLGATYRNPACNTYAVAQSF